MIKRHSTVRGAIIAAAVWLAAPAEAFDYWLVALSWSPSWCAADGGPEAEQCAPERDLGFVLHGLWPQFEEGWPQDCATPHRDPSRRETAAMADVMGSGGLAWRQWRKHGTCSGMAPEDYFALARLAFGRVAAPPLDRRLPAADVEAAFVAANPGFAPEAVVATCRDGLLREVRLCLTRRLTPRACGADVARAACRSDRPLALPAPP
jgi:ribonuclease T2